ncbi:hypothetical protein, partial [Piscirickettsia salmonis]
MSDKHWNKISWCIQKYIELRKKPYPLVVIGVGIISAVIYHLPNINSFWTWSPALIVILIAFYIIHKGCCGFDRSIARVFINGFNGAFNTFSEEILSKK